MNIYSWWSFRNLVAMQKGMNSLSSEYLTYSKNWWCLKFNLSTLLIHYLILKIYILHNIMFLSNTGYISGTIVRVSHKILCLQSMNPWVYWHHLVSPSSTSLFPPTSSLPTFQAPPTLYFPPPRSSSSSSSSISSYWTLHTTYCIIVSNGCHAHLE